MEQIQYPMTRTKIPLHSNKILFAILISAVLITGCSKADELAKESTDKTETGDSTSTTPTTPATPETPTTSNPNVPLKAFSFTEIPYSSTDLINPGRGIEQWHDRNDVNVPAEGVNTQRTDVYYRFPWTRIEGSAQGSYNWSYFDGLVNAAIQRKQRFSFGVMQLYPEGTPEVGLAAYDGGYSSYPEYLHNLMQNESAKDWRKGSTWVPNYNSSHFHARLLALYQAMNAHINNTSYNGVKYKDVIGYIDVRGYGSWGEWHHGGLVDNVSEFPAGTRATAASLKAIIDAHVKGFPNFPLVSIIAAFDANWLPHTMNPPEVAYYALTVKNNWGYIGWRRDQWGATDNYLTDYLQNNNRSYNGMVFKNAIMERWKFAPIVGEPPGWAQTYSNLEGQVRLYHATSFGNGNYGGTLSSAEGSNVRAASKACGYRIKLLSGQAPASITKNTSFNINTVWQNVGIAPAYDNWSVVFELQNASNAAVWSGTSTRALKLFLPATAGTTTSDKFTLPATVTAGTYKLVVKVKDPNGYRPNMQLAINGRNNDGSYTLLTGVVVK